MINVFWINWNMSKSMTDVNFSNAGIFPDFNRIYDVVNSGQSWSKFYTYITVRALTMRPAKVHYDPSIPESDFSPGKNGHV